MPEGTGNQVSYSHADNAGNQVLHPRSRKERCEGGSHIVLRVAGNQALRLDREWAGHQGTHRPVGEKWHPGGDVCVWIFLHRTGCSQTLGHPECHDFCHPDLDRSSCPSSRCVPGDAQVVGNPLDGTARAFHLVDLFQLSHLQQSASQLIFPRPGAATKVTSGSYLAISRTHSGSGSRFHADGRLTCRSLGPAPGARRSGHPPPGIRPASSGAIPQARQCIAP